MNVSGFLIDLDGTIYKGNDIIPGSLDFIKFLKKEKIPFIFLTNNSSNTRDYYLNKLVNMGFEIDIKNILTSAIATARFIKDNRPDSTIFPIATPSVEKELSDIGLKIDKNNPDIVLLTFDRTITFDKLNEGYHFIKNGAELIATHPDDLCPTEESYDVDIGPFIRLFESLTGKKALIIGKPMKTMLEMAALEMNVQIQDTIMVGDRVYTDIKMANDAGIKSIMVLTGEATSESLNDTEVKPSFVLNSVSDIPNFMCQRSKIY